MVLTHLAFTLLMLVFFENTKANKTAPNVNPILDPKRRSEAVDEAFLEQKDILLDMLELKLKEVSDKKKRRAERNASRNNIDEPKDDKCASMLKNVDVKVNVNGISAVGDANVKLKYGTSGKGVVNINATGISNVGQANVELGVGESAVFIPGLSNLFVERHLMDCAKNTATQSSSIRHSQPDAPQPQLNIESNQDSTTHFVQPHNFHQTPQNIQNTLNIQQPQHKPDQRSLLDQTRRQEDNDTVANTTSDELNTSVPTELTTPTAFAYTSPTTSTDAQTTASSLTSLTPYYLRLASEQASLQAATTNGIINAV